MIYDLSIIYELKLLNNIRIANIDSHYNFDKLNNYPLNVQFLCQSLKSAKIDSLSGYVDNLSKIE